MNFITKQERFGTHEKKPIFPTHGTVVKIYNPSDSSSGLFAVDLDLDIGGSFDEIPYVNSFGFDFEMEKPHGLWTPPREQQRVAVIFMNNRETSPIAVGGLFIPSMDFPREKLKDLSSVLDKDKVGLYHFNDNYLEIQSDFAGLYTNVDTDTKKILQSVIVDKTDGSEKIKLEINDTQNNKVINIVIDKTSGGVSITSDDTGSSSEKMVKGDTFKTKWDSLMDGLQVLTVGTPFGPSSVPLNAATFAGLKATSSEMLSTKNKVN